ncbi:MAG TPA: hypothetical protein PK323_08770 [Bacteroidia bacterium]|nr:hypothetical protein [Bacteroidia bacterium]
MFRSTDTPVGVGVGVGVGIGTGVGVGSVFGSGSGFSFLQALNTRVIATNARVKKNNLLINIGINKALSYEKFYLEEKLIEKIELKAVETGFGDYY